MNYIKLGEKLQLGFTAIKCVKAQVAGECDDCFLRGLPFCRAIVGECCRKARPDSQDVIFVEVD